MPTRKLALGPPWCARVPIRKKRRVRGVCHPAPCIPEYRSARAGRVCTLFDCSSCCVHAETGKPWVSRRVNPLHAPTRCACTGNSGMANERERERVNSFLEDEMHYGGPLTFSLSRSAASAHLQLTEVVARARGLWLLNEPVYRSARE